MKLTKRADFFTLIWHLVLQTVSFIDHVNWHVSSGNLVPIHTNPFSNENRAVLLCIRFLSTLQRQKRSPKTEPFENALQSGAIWKRCFLKTLISSVDRENDAIRKQWRHQLKIDTTGRETTRLWVSKMADRRYHLQLHANFVGGYIEVCVRRVHLWKRTKSITAFSKRIRRCNVDGRKRYKNDKCGCKSFLKQSKTAALFSFENGLVWTGC